MKKLVSLLFGILCVILICVTVSAESGEVSWGYRKLDDSSIEIGRCYGYAETMDIPEELDGMTVTTLNLSIFSDHEETKSVNIPKTVSTVTDEYFGTHDFNLTEITVSPENECYTSADNVLFTKDMKELVLYPPARPNTEYTVPDGVEIIGENAFYNAANLISVTVPEGLSELNDFAFADCISMEKINLPQSVTKMEYGVFNGCTSLEEINIISNEEFCSADGVLFNGDMTELQCYPAGKTDSKYTVPDSVIRLKTSAFSDNVYITEINLPDGLTDISAYAFCRCEKLIALNIPEKVWSISFSAFDSSGITSIYIPENVSHIASTAFQDCQNLSAIEVSEDNEYYFSLDGVLFNKDKTDLITYPAGKTDKSYTIPDGVYYVASGAFWGSRYLEEVTVSPNVSVISLDMFRDCEKLNKVNLTDNVTEICEDAFYNTPLLDNQTETVKYLDGWAISCDEDATEVTLKEGIIGIANNAFENCDMLRTVSLPSTLKIIGDYAFYSCDWLEKVTVPLNVTEIGALAFSDCYRLLEVELPDSITTIGRSAFAGSGRLKNLVIPKGITEIPENIVGGCIGLSYIVLHDDITEIGDGAFYGCSSLTDIYYSGDEKQWEKIAIGEDNEILTTAELHPDTNAFDAWSEQFTDNDVISATSSSGGSSTQPFWILGLGSAGLLVVAVAIMIIQKIHKKKYE